MKRKSLCIVVHDVAPATWAGCRWLLDSLHEIGDFPVTLLAVPHYHRGERSRAFERWLQARAERGDEVALHGFTHLDEGTPRGPIDRLRRRFYTRGEGEFAALDFDEATRRLRVGAAWLTALGLAPAGFIAPAWLLGKAAWQALRMQPFEYTCTLRRIHLLQENRSVSCQSQVYSSSSAWRQQASIAWNESLSWLQHGHPIVRLELHPADDLPAVHRSWHRLAHRQAGERRVCTLGTLVDELRTASARSST